MNVVGGAAGLDQIEPFAPGDATQVFAEPGELFGSNQRLALSGAEDRNG
jgi:hypothetical protein